MIDTFLMKFCTTGTARLVAYFCRFEIGASQTLQKVIEHFAAVGI